MKQIGDAMSRRFACPRPRRTLATGVLFVQLGLLAAVPSLLGGGCTPQPTGPVLASPTAAGTLIQGADGSLVLSCGATEAGQSITTVTADLSALGGATAQPLTSTGGDAWSWSGWVTPPTSGTQTISLTATDDLAQTTTVSLTVSVSAPDADRLVLDLGAALVIELVRVPAGSFAMGTASTDAILIYEDGSSEPVLESGWANACRPVHTVTFAAPFYLGRCEITRAQWAAVLGNGTATDPNLPAAGITWDQAVAFCTALSTRVGRTARLPAEAEWEYACKAGSGDTRFTFGNDGDLLTQYAWFADNSGGTLHDVGGRTANAWGLYDMHGNVWEWCQDLWHADYAAAPADGSIWNAGGNTGLRVLRGGSCTNNADASRSAYRNSFAPTTERGDFGLRIVVSAE
jgi:formylglycine-generating enzyme required for sulfatase activity